MPGISSGGEREVKVAPRTSQRDRGLEQRRRDVSCGGSFVDEGAARRFPGFVRRVISATGGGGGLLARKAANTTRVNILARRRRAGVSFRQVYPRIIVDASRLWVLVAWPI